MWLLKCAVESLRNRDGGILLRKTPFWSSCGGNALVAVEQIAP